MIRAMKKNWLAITACMASFVVALFWLAMRVNWSGISKVLGADSNQSFFVMQLPLMLCILMGLLFVFAVVATMIWSPRKRAPFIASIAVSAVFAIGIGVVIAMGAKDYIRFFIWDFLMWLAVSVLIALFGVMLFYPPVKKCKKCVIIKCCLLTLIIMSSILIGFDVKANCFTYEPVVYAVNDQYQIVFSTNANSVAWVSVGGEKYYELYNGSMSSSDNIHKIIVSQDKLDEAGGYTIHAKQAIYRGPFGGYMGKSISKTYRFEAVDTSDGLQYYTLSDVHSGYKGAVASAISAGDIDMLIMLGDNVGMIERQEDAQFANKLAHAVTKGSMPVVYARGNHEIKGKYAEQLHKYVGADGDKFYYYFSLSNVFGVVMDMGEDHDDGWWEYYDTDRFNLYRDEQTQWLQSIVASDVAKDYDYTMGLCHIPVNLVNNRNDHYVYKTAWTELFNQLNVDIHLSGHQHMLNIFEPNTIVYDDNGKLQYNPAYIGAEGKTYGGTVTDYRFWSFLVGRSSEQQTSDTSTPIMGRYIGLKIEVNFGNNTQTACYLNAKGDKIGIVGIFNPKDYGTTTTFPLK